MDTRPVQPGDAMARRRCLYHPPWLAFRICGRNEKAGIPHTVRVHHAGRSAERARRRNTGGPWLFSSVDWIGKRLPADFNAMQRGVTVEQVHNAVRLSKDNGIQTGMFLMWGYEGEEMEDVEATVNHVKTCRPDVFFTTVSYPIKGTPYFDRVQDRLVSPAGWAQTLIVTSALRTGTPGLLSICRRSVAQRDVGEPRPDKHSGRQGRPSENRGRSRGLRTDSNDRRPLRQHR